MVKKVIFVCAGNICRSPLAEGIFIHKLKQKNILHKYEVDSAGTGAWHVGERPDPRSLEIAAEHGVELPGVSRQFMLKDIKDFDIILAMDSSNYRDIKRMCDPVDFEKLQMMRDFDVEPHIGQSVPDPYYNGGNAFNQVYDMLDVCCENLIQHLENTK